METEDKKDKKVQNESEYIDGIEKRVTLYNFLKSLTTDELSKLEKELKEKYNIEIEETLETQQGDDWKRVKLLGKILERNVVLKGCDVPPEKRQGCEIYMDGICKDVGLSTDKLYEESCMPSLTEYRERLKNKGICFCLFIFSILFIQHSS